MQGDGHFGKQDSVLYSDARGRGEKVSRGINKIMAFVSYNATFSIKQRG